MGIQRSERKSFNAPDDVRIFPHGSADLLRIGGGVVGRFVFQPGWRCSNDVKPIAKTRSCQVPHFQYQVSGRLAIKMDDGTEFIAEAGDVSALSFGHDAWVVGEEPVVVIDWWGASRYAKQMEASDHPHRESSNQQANGQQTAEASR